MTVVILEDLEKCCICGGDPQWLVLDCLPCCEICREQEYSHLEVIK